MTDEQQPQPTTNNPTPPSTEGTETMILLPNGRRAKRQGQIETERAQNRGREDQTYTPVIIKRNDETVRHPDDTLERAIQEGLEQIKRPQVSLALSSIAGGLIVGFSALAVAVVTQATIPLHSPMLTRLATAVVYPVGFIVCIISGAQLFTEHTATAVYPVLDRQAKFWSLLRLWGIVILGNLIGATLIAALLTSASSVVQANEGILEMGHHLVHFERSELLISSVLAGWLMAQGAWLVLATPPDFSKVALIYIVTFIIGLGGFHHSIAGTAEICMAMFTSEDFTLSDTTRFVLLALLGNMIGGSVFVAILNYGHIRQTQSVED
ncbi:formate/nitrite transporter family protein [Thalassoroseus pseudoceratinae]|uniref:formate/nitrite transporter family protein n=1 Tax=Thalassoroseus pseudoceratinae TaxID=2713176 RepID=UPI0019812696|nr:formate/nitrite transporter family protein [Thalassoroseus pseudoceratinae]